MGVVTESFPDISFIEDATMEEILNQMIVDYQEKYKEITGREVSLGLADPYRLILYACALQIYQAMQYADYAGKMSFLKYARGDFLDNLAALRGVKRMRADKAVTELLFSMEKALEQPVGIPKGTRATNGNEVFFNTDEYAEIKPGETSVAVKASCTEPGSAGNGFEAGEINVIVNTLPFVSAVTNLTKTEGGAETEDDDKLRDRIYNAPGSYSVAGSGNAYIYWAKTASPAIGDVAVFSEEPGQVNVRFVLDGGILPEQALIDKVSETLNGRNIRPLTDRVMVGSPDVVPYDIAFTYYIPAANQTSAETIQKAVETAVSTFRQWQSEKIGRDINPSNLIHRLVEAGAKRVVVEKPEFTILKGTEIAALGNVTIHYGGIEDD